ncbi:MAG: hypothetical protein KBT47_01575, partial [Armatimonadetes bacterium]|nr:hypothetical protein [Candidatus Hippobium faecium]
CGFNCIFSGDKRKEVSDWCIIKGIVLLPYEKPTCSPDNAEIFRKTNRPVIFSFRDTEDEKLIKKITSPVYIGTDFISNNTNQYIAGTLSQGYIDPVSNNIDIISETEITVGEFQTIPFTDCTEQQDDRISFVNLWHNSNIIAKKIYIGKNTEFRKSSVLVSRFQTDENTWEILFSSNEYIPNLCIITEDEISKNNFDIFPGETVKVTFTNISGEPDFQLKTV